MSGSAAILGAVLLSLAAAHAALGADRTVAMSGAQFVPASVTVNVGDTVTWRNDDGIAHSARADNGSFDTGIFSSGSRSHAFTQAGSFGYFCAVHPSTMRGTVTVAAAATPAPTPPPPTPPPATARPTPAPTTAAPATASPSPSPSPSPVAPASPSAAPTASSTPSPSPLAVQASPTATPGSSPPSDGDQTALVAAAVAAGIALTGVVFWAIRRR